MTTNELTPLSLGHINQGQFLTEVNEALRKLQAELILFYQRYGADVVPVKGKLKITVAFEQHKKAVDQWVVSARHATDRPAAPAMSSMGLASEDDDGTPAVLVAPSGSRRDDPRQLVLMTDSGDLVDPDSGELKGRAERPVSGKDASVGS